MGSQKVAIDKMVIGMLIDDVYSAGGKLVRARSIVENREQIDTLQRLGVGFVYHISGDEAVTVGNEGARGLPERPEISREKAYYKELSRAKEVHQVTLETARRTLSAARLGRQVSIDLVAGAAEGMVESIRRNPDALVSLAQIKGYDEYTYVHSVNVGVLITSLAHAMGYSEEDLRQTCIGGLLHDIGKMRVPEEILNKPGKFTDREFAIMKKHPEDGLAILKNLQDIPALAKTVIIEHHERYNGQGYPHGRSQGEIHEVGHIAAVADVYDAMTTDRVYRPAWTPQRTLGMIFQGCDIEYSRRIVELFTRHLGIYPVGSFVRLANGEMGVVVRVDKGEMLTPDMLVLFDHRGNRLPKPLEYRLFTMQKQENGHRYRIERSLNPCDFDVVVGDYIQGNQLL